jgi:hypothetical protein
VFDPTAGSVLALLVIDCIAGVPLALLVIDYTASSGLALLVIDCSDVDILVVSDDVFPGLREASASPPAYKARRPSVFAEMMVERTGHVLGAIAP